MNTRDITLDIDSFAESFMRAIESKDPYTAGHSLRVAELSRLLAHEYGCCADDISEIHVAAHFHDIGKIGIPDGILLRTGAISAAEYAVIRQHPETGYRILAGCPGLAHIARIVREHHERFDGSGYPQGLKGETISLGARIVAVADSFDAMTTLRTYRRAVSIAAAVDEIRRGAGSQFDPAVSAVLRCVHARKPEAIAGILAMHCTRVCV